MIHFHKEAGLVVYLSIRAEQSSEAFYAGKVRLYLPAFLTNSATLPYAGWDMREGKSWREELGRQIAHNSAFHATAYHERQPLAFAWGRNIGAGTAELHFLSARRDPALIFKAGRQIIGELAPLYPSLVALVPEPFQGAHRLARKLGFREKLRLVKACHLARRGRFVDGRLYLWEGGESGE